MRARLRWICLIVLILPSTSCSTGLAILAATEIETTTIDVEQVRARRIDRGWKIEIDWEDGEGSELEWTPMAVLDQGPVQRTGPLVVPRRGWLESDPARNGLWHDDAQLYLFKNGNQVATYPIERTEPLSKEIRYAALAAGLPITIALDIVTLPFQLLIGGAAVIVLLNLDEDDP